MVNALTTKGRLLVSAINTTGTNVIDAAGAYEYCELGNAGQFRNRRIEF